MRIGEAAGLLEQYQYSDKPPQHVDFEKLCDEIMADLDSIAPIIFLGGLIFVDGNSDLLQAASVWMDETNPEKRRVIESLALDWMTEAELKVCFE